LTCKKENKLARLIQLYVFCSMLGTILTFIFREAAMVFYTVGASSGYVAFGIATSDTINIGIPLGLTLMLWAILFPIALFIAFIKSLKKKCRFMFILVVADTAIVVLWVLFAYIAGNRYGAQVFFFDAFVSVLYSTVLFWQYKHSKTAEDGSLA